MAGYLTTHVLDTARGRPAAGMRIDLHRLDGEARAHLRTVATNADGRSDEAILPRAEFTPGDYELTFHVGAWLRAQGGAEGGDSPFLDLVPVRFSMTENDHYHVPLLISPFGYSTYRGS